MNTIYYPAKIHIEQTSLETTARYKASLIECNSLADITGGFGVDSYYFSENINTIHHFEKDQLLSNIAKHNYTVFGKKNIECFKTDGVQAVLKRKYDVIYADPSRRHDSKGKVFFLKDCEPNIPRNLEVLMEQCDRMLVKTSPMLDITVGLNELECVYELHIIAVNNEVKELLWLLAKDHNQEPKVKTINISKKGAETFDFNLTDVSITKYGAPQKYLYVPNAAIMKSGAFGLISNHFQVKKLQKHSHLYTSEQLVEFPGRCFIVEEILPYHKKEVKAFLKNKKANISTRNFPESVASLKKRWKIRDGGSEYLFFTTLEDNKKVILSCTKA